MSQSYQQSVGRHDDAHRVFKRLKAGMVSADELGAEEFGLLYLYYPHTLPDVDVTQRGGL